jgi:hypothetical protein
MVVVLAAGLVIAAPARAQDFCEDGDAGSLPGSSQTVTGLGAVSRVVGELTGETGPGVPDYEDMYLVNIPDPLAFSAQVTMPGADPQLWLFAGPFGGDGQPPRGGLLGNNGVVDPTAMIQNMADDMQMQMVTQPGIYFLAITSSTPGGGREPISISGPIFEFIGEMVSSPDGPGGTEEISAWIGGSSSAEYAIDVEGIEPFPPPPPPCECELDGDGIITFNDLLVVLSVWEPTYSFDTLLCVLSNWKLPCPFGACCFPDTTCVELDPPSCIQLGGVFQGPGTECAAGTCP